MQATRGFVAPMGAVVLAVAAAGCAAPAAEGVAPVALTWEKARIGIPARYTGSGVVLGRRPDGAVIRALAGLAPGLRIPTVLYVHGCSGFGNSGRAYAAALLDAGYAVVAPDSFARPGRPRTCDPRRHVTVVPRRVIGAARAMRIAEIRHALEHIGELAWVDRDNLFLLGHSQGGTAAAQYKGAGFRARVVSGSRCTRGIGAAAAEPVLAVYSLKDPWFKNPAIRNCRQRAEGKTVEAMELPGAVHVVVKVAAARDAILGFLARHTGRRR